MPRVPFPVRILLFASFFILLSATGSSAQQFPETLDRPLRIFLDCRADCDFDYYRTEIPYLDFVRDRVDSDFHVMVLRQGTGGGGNEYEIQVIGVGPFAGVEETYSLFTDRDATFDERRQEQVRTFQMALLPWVTRTPVARAIRITAEDVEPAGIADENLDDPWNLWVFRIGGSGRIESEEQRDQYSFDTFASANRTTEALKVDLGFRADLERNDFVLSDGRTVVSQTRNANADALVVRSMNDHWSLGGLTRVGSSTEDNQDRRTRVAFATEYNVFPYAEATERQLTVLYSLGVSDFDYIEETIYEKTRETLMDQALNVAYEVRQPWGFVNASAEASHFLHDFSKNRIDVQGRVNFRIFRGLSINLDASGERIRDQLYLPRGEATDEEILTDQRQLATGYRYDASIGFSYNFGSIFNTVVNPRFDGRNRRF